MNLAQLKTQFPKVYRTFVADGVKRERDRIVAHIDLGQKTGDMRTAIDAIKSGDTMTPAIFSAYMAAGRNRQDVLAREADDDLVDAVLQNLEHPESGFTDPFEKAVADRFAELLDTSAGDANIEDLEEA